MLEDTVALICAIIVELTILFIGMALVPILHETKYKRYVKYVFPVCIFIGSIVLFLFIIYLKK